MAGLNGRITIEGSEYRPCLIGGRKHLFHKWGFNGETVAIVESEDGRIHAALPENVKFLDSGNYFHRFMFWREENDDEKS